MQEKELIPHLYRTEFKKLAAVLCKLFGMEHIEVAEDIVSDTFLTAAETWGLKGVPENPTAWLYAVAKNKAKDYLKRLSLFNQKIVPELKLSAPGPAETEIDLSSENITDCQLQMMFAICDPAIPVEAQIGLSLRILCGFGIEEIADAFLSNKETINKRLFRAKETLKSVQAKVELPAPAEIGKRLETVLTTIYLLFNEGYHSLSQNSVLRKDLCLEAMRLNYLLVKNEATNTPSANALLSLMCFHSSRFEARINPGGDPVLYEEQDTSLWNQELIAKGLYYLGEAARNEPLSKYHLEAAIAYWHTVKTDSHEKWESILQLYNKLLVLEYSPVAALNRTYALSRASGKQEALSEAEKLNLTNNYQYYALLGNLYTDIDNRKAIENLERARDLAKSETEKRTLQESINKIERSGKKTG